MTTRHAHLASCGCVDVHTHVVPLDFPKYAGRHAGARWPSMSDAKPCHRHVLLDGKVYRTVSHQNWDIGVRSGDMDATGIERQVLSAMPELLSYWLEPEDGVAMCRFLNETIAGMVVGNPGRFAGLGAVPLQDVDLAIGELEHAVRVLGLAGVEIGTNVNGVPIGAERFQPFFRACAELGAAVFVHALRPAGMDRLVGPPVFEQTIAFPGEVGLSAASMISGGTLFANPELRIAFSHGGGSLQILIARMQHAWECIPGVRDALREAPRDSARRMYFDDLLYDKSAIEALLRLVGTTQVMIGTDYPFAILDKDPLGRVASLELPPEVQRALVRDNALRWLGVSASQAR